MNNYYSHNLVSIIKVVVEDVTKYYVLAFMRMQASSNAMVDLWSCKGSQSLMDFFFHKFGCLGVLVYMEKM